MPDTSHAELLARLSHDQHSRWASGQRILVEDYLEQHPELAADEEAVLELIAREYQTRWVAGESPSTDEYLRRFPAYRDRLEDQLGRRASSGVPRRADTGPAHPIPETLTQGDAIQPAASLPGVSQDGAVLTPDSERFALTTGQRATPETLQGPAPDAGLRSPDTIPTLSGLDRLREIDQSPPIPTIPGYEIQCRLGKGGMGVVYKAWEIALKRPVALKMILGSYHAQSDDLVRFTREAEAMARLHHPNIVQVYRVGAQDGVPFFAMEYIDGSSLDQRLNGTPLAGNAAARLVEALAQAAHYAHEHGIIHRDLKPANVLLGEDGSVKLTDFGLAKDLGDAAGPTQSGAVMGTPSYMAPEQAQGKIRDICPATDVYALGAILYETVTGRPPFKAATIAETLLQVLTNDPVPPRRLQPGIPRDLETISLKCLEKNPGRRYASAAALAADLARFLRREPIRARPASPVERAWKWARRRPAVAALAVVTVLAVCLGVAAVMISLKRRAEHLAADLKHIRETEEARDQVRNLLLEGEDAARRQDWRRARDTAHDSLAQIDREPALPREWRGRAETILARAEAGLRVREQEIRERQKRDAAAATLAQFRHHRDDALFHSSQASGLDPAVSRTRTRQAAVKALGLFSPDAASESPGIDWTFRPIRADLPQTDQEDVKADCYELLLVLADARAGSANTKEPSRNILNAYVTVLLQNQPMAAASCTGYFLTVPEKESLSYAVQLLQRAARLKFQTRTWHERLAGYLARAGDQKGAQRERGAAARIPADDGDPIRVIDYFMQGTDHFRQGRFDAAILSLETALRLRPRDFWAHYYLALCYLRLQEQARAEANLSACLAQRPDFVWAYLDRAFAHGEQGHLARNAVPPRKDLAAFHFQAAEADYNRALSLNPDTDAFYKLHLGRGMLSFRQEKFIRATAEVRKAIKRKPKQYQGYALLADLYERAKRYGDALDEADKAVRLKPDQPDLYRRRAQIHLDLLHTDDALADLKQAIDLRRKQGVKGIGAAIVALLQDSVSRGILLQRTGQVPDALVAYEKALQLEDNLKKAAGDSRLPLNLLDAHLRRCVCLLWCAEHQNDPPRKLKLYQATVEACDLALKIPGARERPEPYRARGLARTHLGDSVGAVHDYTTALALERKPDRATRAQRGWVYLDGLSAPRLALADFEALLKGNSRDGLSRAGLAQAKARLGQHAEAAKEAAQALEDGPGSSRLSFNVARAYSWAVAAAETDPALQAQPVLRKAARDSYEFRALEALRQALAALPARERSAFWRDTVQQDASFNPIRRGTGFAQIAAEFAR
jgi:eukaryotic-like serine/threonine-protein kinase